MNKNTLLKLKNNPHYKMSAKEKAELAKVERKPMIEFGTPTKHDNKLPLHQSKLKKKKRKSK